MTPVLVAGEATWGWMELPAPACPLGAYDVLVVAPLGASELRYEKADADWTSRRDEIPRRNFMVTH